MIKGRNRRKYRKTIEALLYIANKDSRLYWILKTIWLAERIHLSKYGSMILGDSYYAMSHGPVPSRAYDIIKGAREGGWVGFAEPDPRSVFKTPDKRTVIPLRKAETSLLSETEIECLDKAYEVLKDKSFGAVKEFSHTESFDEAAHNDEIPFEAFVRDLENGEEILDYLQSI